MIVDHLNGFKNSEITRKVKAYVVGQYQAKSNTKTTQHKYRSSHNAMSKRIFKISKTKPEVFSKFANVKAGCEMHMNA